MTTAKLVTVRKPQISIPTPSIRRKTKRKHRRHHDGDGVTYRENFNSNNSTLVKHGTLSTTLQQNTPTILTMNRQHTVLINNIMLTITEMNGPLKNNLHALDKQQQEAHDTRIVQTGEYRRNHTTPDTGKHTPHPTHSLEVHLIDSSHTTAVLAATINTP